MRRRVGLYLGTNSIGGVVTEKDNVVSSVKFDLSSTDKNKGDETLSEDMLWEALINKTLRELRADINEVYVSLSDKDFIIRSFELPLMKNREVESSVIYEAENYIPFKMGELKWDFKYTRLIREGIVKISILGIKKTDYKRFGELFSRINIVPLSIEPSFLSLAKVVKSIKEFSKIDNFVILDFNEYETYLTFFNHNIAIFNRHLTIPKMEGAFNSDRFMETIRLSFQYFEREFKNCTVGDLIILGNYPKENITLSLRDNLSVEVHELILSDIAKNAESSIENIKALGAVNVEYNPKKFKIVLKNTEKRLGGQIQIPPLKIGVLSLLAGVGLLAVIFQYVFLGNKIAIEEFQFRKQQRETVLLSKKTEGMPLKSIEAAIKDKMGEIASLNEIVSSRRSLSILLKKLPHMFTQGMWLNHLEINRRGGKYGCTLSGYVFLGDGYKERLSIDDFVNRLKEDKLLKKLFSKIEMVSSKKKLVKGFKTTNFALNME